MRICEKRAEQVDGVQGGVQTHFVGWLLCMYRIGFMSDKRLLRYICSQSPTISRSIARLDVHIATLKNSIYGKSEPCKRRWYLMQMLRGRLDVQKVIDAVNTLSRDAGLQLTGFPTSTGQSRIWLCKGTSNTCNCQSPERASRAPTQNTRTCTVSCKGHTELQTVGVFCSTKVICIVLSPLLVNCSSNTILVP
ncbi:hypothetical protein GOODEAATRI_024940 [Goodea atripinnis]|uniref:Uncharacterized protein n=1 Tax=Goodea atripinnis TaxID=208336 RepID=A0ABV0NRD1_9TELE